MIDLNSDLGEGFGVYRLGEDEEILQVVSSANIACGFHAGDPRVMAHTVRAAVDKGVAIGAHPSYPDRVGFGRRHMDVSPDELTWDVVYQIGALDGIARAAGGRVSYVKPHGALYNRIVIDEAQATAVVRAIAAYDSDLILLTLPGSVAMQVAEANGLRTVSECFADRAYTADGRLVPRGQPGAVIHDEATVVARAVHLATKGTITSTDGATVTVAAQSICLHGDTPGAAQLARGIRAGLEQAGVAIGPFSS
jgi:UPF0271 protein